MSSRRLCIYSFILGMFFVSLSAAQSYQRGFGGNAGDIGTCIKRTPDSNYVLCGFTGSFGAGQDDIYLLKTDTLGNLLWSKTYGGTGSDLCYYLDVCSDGGFILCGGRSNTSSNYDVFLLRTDANGNLLWQKTFGSSSDEFGWYVLQTADSGFVVSGFTYSVANDWDGYLLKTDAQGNLLWTKKYGGTGNDNFYGMSATGSGGFIVTGSTTTNSFGDSDMWLLKLDANGDTIWTRQYGVTTEDGGNAVVETSDGGFAIGGDIHSFTTPGAHNAALLKTDALGNIQWVKTYGSNPGTEIAYDLLQTPDNGFVLLCNTNFYGSGSKDMMLVRTDSLGNMDWAKSYGDSLQEDAWFLIQNADKGFSIVGASESFGAGLWDVYLLRTDSMGDASCHDQTITPTVRIPVMQTRSGFPISSGGGLTAHTLVSSNPSTLFSNPCSLQDVEEQLNDIHVYVFPDPVLSSAIISFSKNMHHAVFELYDVLGNKISEYGFSGNEIIFERKELPPGLYFFRISSREEISLAGKLILQ